MLEGVCDSNTVVHLTLEVLDPPLELLEPSILGLTRSPELLGAELVDPSVSPMNFQGEVSPELLLQLAQGGLLGLLEVLAMGLNCPGCLLLSGAELLAYGLEGGAQSSLHLV